VEETKKQINEKNEQIYPLQPQNGCAVWFQSDNIRKPKFGGSEIFRHAVPLCPRKEKKSVHFADEQKSRILSKSEIDIILNQSKDALPFHPAHQISSRTEHKGIYDKAKHAPLRSSMYSPKKHGRNRVIISRAVRHSRSMDDVPVGREANGCAKQMLYRYNSAAVLSTTPEPMVVVSGSRQNSLSTTINAIRWFLRLGDKSTQAANRK